MDTEPANGKTAENDVDAMERAKSAPTEDGKEKNKDRGFNVGPTMTEGEFMKIVKSTNDSDTKDLSTDELHIIFVTVSLITYLRFSQCLLFFFCSYTKPP